MGLQYAATSLGALFPAGAVAASIVGWSWLRLNRLLAVVFGLCFVGAVGAAVALKLAAAAYAPPLEAAGLFHLSQGAPSGHAVDVAVVYGGAAVLFARLGRGAARIAGLAWCAAVIAVVCVTRLTLHAHTAADVAAGLTVGFAFCALFARAAQVQARPGAVQPTGVLLAAMIAVALLALASGIRISSTQFL